MKKLSAKVIGGVFLGTATLGACTLGVSQFLKANDNNVYGFYENQNLPIEKSAALIEEDVREANAKVDVAKEEVQKKTEAKETAVKNLENAEKAVKNAEQKKKAADDEVQKAVATKKAADETLKKAEEQVKTAKTDEERKAAEEAKKLAEEEARKAEAKVKAAEEEAQKAEEEKRLAEEEAKKAEEAKRLAEEEAQKAEEAKKLAEEQARKLEEERQAAAAEEAKKATVQQVAEKRTIVEENTSSVTQSNSTPSVAEETNPSTEDAVTIIKNAVQKTEEAKSLTVRNVKEKWTKEYDKNNGTELIVYYDGANDGGAIPTGVLYSYTNTSNAKQISLFKRLSTTSWSIPNTNSIKGMAGWEMQFSGKRSVGVIELELVKKLRFLVNATPLVTSSLNGDAYKNMGSNIKFYRVAVSNKQFNEWLSTYYSDELATDTAMIDVGINSNGYVCYLNARILGDNKTRNFEIVLANANSTKVPTADELNLNDNDVLELEKAYKKNYGCDIEWAKDKDGKDYYYWVCGSNKHVNQHDF